MRKLILLFAIALMATTSLTAQNASQIAGASQWTWFGIDYTHCYFLMPMDFPSVSDLEAKFEAWNNLVLTERDKYIDKTIGKSRKIKYDIDMIKERNAEIDAKSRLTEDGFKTSHLSSDMIQDIVDNYDIDEGMKGIGLVLIAESYSKPNVKGAYYVTFFDMESRQVLYTERMLGKPSGFGLRNYWAGSYRDVLKDLGKEF
jgi:hypothetical protein